MEWWLRGEMENDLQTLFVSLTFAHGERMKINA